MIDIFSDQCVCISTKFNSGTVTFEWTKPSNKTIYDIMTIRDTKHDNWTSVTENTFDVSDALLFDSISIIVKVPESKINNTLTYTGWILRFMKFNIFERFMSMNIWIILLSKFKEKKHHFFIICLPILNHKVFMKICMYGCIFELRSNFIL